MSHTRPQLLFSIAATLLVAGCAGNTLIETPSVYETTETPLFVDLAPALQGDTVEVLYVTDRLPQKVQSGVPAYGSGRSMSSALGVAQVAIEPDNGKPDSARKIELMAVEELVRFPETPYLYRVADGGRIEIEPSAIRERESAWLAAREEIVERLALTPKKDVYLDVHGVATEFDKAILDLATFWHFLGREGVPIAYTWPAGSEGLLFYTADRESGEFTILHLKEFLRLLAEIPEVERVHVTAHSRGTDVVITALRELIIEARAGGLDPRTHFKLENLVLMAADIDLEVDMQRIEGEAMAPAFGRATIYTNTEDKALAVAAGLFSSQQRVGSVDLSELTDRQREFVHRTSNLNVIVYDGKGGGVFRHGYYDDPAVSSDMLMLLRYGWGPGEGERQGLQQLDENTWRIDATYWNTASQ